MNASIGLRGQARSRTIGGVTRLGGRNAQWSRSSAVIGLPGTWASSARAGVVRPSIMAIVRRGARRMGQVSPERGSSSGQDRPDDRAGGVGEPIVAAVVGKGQPGVVEA